MALTRLKFAALAAGAAMLTIGSVPASAASVDKVNPVAIQAAVGSSAATDFSSQRRRYGGRYYGRRGIGPGAAVGALAAGVIGSAIIASQPRRYYYDDGYYGGPRYYGPGYGYGGGYYDGGW